MNCRTYIPLHKNKKWLKENGKLIKQKYEAEELLLCEVAKLFGISSDRMRWIFVALNIRLRPHKENQKISLNRPEVKVKMKKSQKFIIICKNCGKESEVTAWEKDRKFCSCSCLRKFQKKQKIIKICPNKNCTKGVDGERKRFEVTKGSKYPKYCCKECYWETLEEHKSWNLGLQGSDPTKENYDARLVAWNKDLSANPSKKNYDKRVAKKAKKSIGQKRSLETRRKIRKSKEGIAAWNLGLTRFTDERVAKNAEKVRKSFEERVEKYGLARSFFSPNFNLWTIPICTKIDELLSKKFNVPIKSRYAGLIGGKEDNIGSKSLDFSNKNFSPIIIVEFNESTHDEEKDRTRWNYIIDKSQEEICPIEVLFLDEWRDPKILNEKKQWGIAKKIVKTIMKSGCKPIIRQPQLQLF